MKKLSLSTEFEAALTMFGVYCGAGFATGRELVQYVTRHGVKGLWIPVISWIALGIIFYIVYYYSCLSKSKNYKEFAEKFYSPYGKIAIFVWDVIIVFTAMIALGGFMATGATMLQALFKGPYFIWIILFTIISIILGIYGTEFVARVGAIITIPLISLLLITIVLGVSHNYGNLIDVLTGTVSDVSDTSWTEVFYDIYNTVGVQISFVASAIVIGGSFKTRKEIKTASVGGSAICCCMMYLGSLLIYAYYPAINEETLPILKIANEHPFAAILTLVYPIAVLLAVMSSITPVVSGITNRFLYIGKSAIPNEKARIIILNCVIIILAALISSFGLKQIVHIGFKISASLRLPLIGLPLLLLGYYKIKLLQNAQKLSL